MVNLKRSIKEKILPKKKKDRLNQLRKELGMKKGGSALKPVDKEKNPGLAKLPTQVRNKMGYMKKGGMAKKKMNMGGKADLAQDKKTVKKVKKFNHCDHCHFNL